MEMTTGGCDEGHHERSHDSSIMMTNFIVRSQDDDGYILLPHMPPPCDDSDAPPGGNRLDCTIHLRNSLCLDQKKWSVPKCSAGCENGPCIYCVSLGWTVHTHLCQAWTSRFFNASRYAARFLGMCLIAINVDEHWVGEEAVRFPHRGISEGSLPPCQETRRQLFASL